MTYSRRESDALRWMLPSGSAAAALVLRVDWSATPLGPIESWPRSLKTTVAMMLHSRHPMFLWWGPELVQIYNDAYIPSFGVGKHPAAMGQRAQECWPEIWSIIGPQILDVMERGIPSWHEDALVPIERNGQIEDVYWTYGYSPVFGDDGAIAGTFVVCTETTGRVLAQRHQASLQHELEQYSRRLHEFFAQAPAGICILSGPALSFEFANDHYRALVGQRELVGRPLLEALPELAGQGLDALLREVLRTGVPYVGREHAVTLDHAGLGVPAQRFYTFVYSPMRGQAGLIDAVIALALDVTEEVAARRNADDAARQLRESERQFHLLAETIPQLAWAARTDGYIDWYNQRWFEYTGTTAADMQGWGWTAVHDPARIDDIVAAWKASLTSGEPFEMDFELRGRDGVMRWHLTRAVPFRDEAGNIVRWFGTNTDIDVARRASQERLALLEAEKSARATAEFASRAKDEFLATASHELRTPLNAILGWAHLLHTGKLEPADVLRATDSIQRNARAQVRLIEDILDGSRIITGQLKLELRQLDLGAVVDAAIESVRAAADSKRIAIRVTIDPTATLFIGDPDRLQQVVWNLAANAIKFTPKEGEVHVALERMGTDVRLSVRDNGQGIDAAFLPHVFERFRQAEGSTTRRYGGLGLGLALVRHLVEAHGGSVSASSDGPGTGSVFTVMLPVPAVVEPSQPAPERTARTDSIFVPRGHHLTGARVLVVDDEADAREVVATALQVKGALVSTARNVAEALTILGTHAFDVLVSDIGMPGSDGYELIRGARRITGTRGDPMLAVALTAYAREEDRRRALEAGFDAHVAKPVEPARLVEAVAELLSGAELARSRQPEALAARSELLVEFQRVLRQHGVDEALRVLNARTTHRFTGIYRFDPPMLRNVALHDADAREPAAGADAALEETYCSIVGAHERPFATADALADARLGEHAAREVVRSYCGVLLASADGSAFGTLCHFDFVPCDVPVAELAVMQGAAALLMQHLATAKRS